MRYSRLGEIIASRQALGNSFIVVLAGTEGHKVRDAYA